MLTRIVHYLKKTECFVSVEDLSRALKITRSGVWKYIEELRANGYEIEALSRNGYRLLSCPDTLSPAEVQFKLGTRKFGCDVRHFESLDSTMNEAFKIGMAGAPEGSLVVAETQAKGRGRMGRSWMSPRGKGIYASLLLRPSCAVMDVAKLTLVAAVAVSEAVENVTALRPLIKWPNDLLLNGRKLCGILTELRAEVDRVEFVVVGIGLNVNATVAQLVPEATSLRQEMGKNISRVALLQEVLRVFEKKYLALSKDGSGPVFAEWKARSATLNKRVRFEERGAWREGLAVDLADDGGLLVRLDSGDVIKKISGDVLL